MSDELILSTFAGSETFDGAMAKCMTFMTGRPLDKDKPLFVAAKEGFCRRVGAFQKLNAGNHANVNADCGHWIQTSYAIPDGRVIKLFAMRSIFGAEKRTANIVIRMRDGAGLKRITVPLTQHPRANIQHAVYEGRFDVLTPAEATEYGVPIPDQFRRFYEAGAREGFIRIEHLDNDSSARPMHVVREVQTEEGETQQVKDTVKPRGFDFGDD
jgi:hypothetical protein